MNGPNETMGWVALHGAAAAALLAPAAGQNVAKLEPEAAAPGDSFGYAVDIDGDWMVVGAFRDDAAGLDAGAGYVLRRGVAGWELAQDLLPQNALARGCAGYAVAISGDVLALGAPGPAWENSVLGVVQVFEYDGATWTQTARVENPTGEKDDQFGRSVELSGDRLIVGAPHDDSLAPDGGRAYVFERTNGWNLEAALFTLDVATARRADAFGISVDLWGLQAIVGASHADRVYANAGCAYRFYGDGGNWYENGQLVADDPRPYSSLGLDVAATWDQSVAGAFLAVDSAGVVTGAAYAEENPVPWSEAFCACPQGGACGGAQADAGCTNSSGSGAVIETLGTPSLTATDLGLRLRSAPKKVHTFLLGGPVGQPVPLRSGLLCLAGGKALYLGKTQNSGQIEAAPGAVALVSAGVYPGDTLGFQFYFEDKRDGCQGWNTSSGVAVTFTP